MARRACGGKERTFLIYPESPSGCWITEKVALFILCHSGLKVGGTQDWEITLKIEVETEKVFLKITVWQSNFYTLS